MKKIFVLTFIYCFLFSNSFAQRLTIMSIESKLITHQGVEFVGELKDNVGELHLFPRWKNNGLFYIDGEIFNFSNVNFNVTTNNIDCRVKGNKLFVFKKNDIDSVSINKSLFKKVGSSFYEVLFEKNNNMFLKKYDIKYQEVKQRRLAGTRGKAKSLLVYKYLIKFDNEFKRIELNKKSIIELFETDKKVLMKFVMDNKLSYKKEKDIAKIFKFML